MADRTEDKGKSPRRYRRWVLLLGVLLVLGGLAYLTNPNRYRAVLESQIEERTGFDAAIGTVKLDLFPGLNVEIDHAELSGKYWRAWAEGLSASGSLWALIRGRIDVHGIEVNTLTAEIPGSPRDWIAVSDEIARGVRSKSTDGKSGRVQLTALGPIDVDRFLLQTPDSILALYEGSVSLSDPVAKTFTVDVDGRSPAGGADSLLTASVALARTPGAGLATIDGSGALSDFSFSWLWPSAPEAHVNATFSTTSTARENLGIAVNGDVEVADFGEADGEFHGTFRYTPEAIAVEDFVYDAQDGFGHAEFIRHTTGELRLEIVDALVEGDALDAILKTTHGRVVRVDATEEAFVRATEVVLERSAQGIETFTRNAVAFEGLGVLNSQGDPIAERSSGRVSVRDGGAVFELESPSGFALSGSIQPDFDDGRIVFEAAGRATLTEAVLPPALRGRNISEWKQPIRIDRFGGAYAFGVGVERAFVVDATFEPGIGVLTVEDRSTAFTVAAGTLAGEKGAFRFDLDVVGEAFGETGIAGSFDVPARSVMAAVEADVPRTVAYFAGAERVPTFLDPLIAQYERSTVELTLAIPESDKEPMNVRAVHTRAPRLEATVLVGRAAEDGYRFGDIDAKAELLPSVAAELLPANISVDDPIQATFESDADGGTFSATVNLTGSGVSIGNRLHKRRGDPLRIDLSGGAGESWGLETVAVDCLGERFVMRAVNDGLVADPTMVDLAALTPLAPDGGHLKGALEFSFDTSRNDFSVTFADAAFDLMNDLGLRKLDGYARVESGTLVDARIDLSNRAGSCTAEWSDEGGEGRGRIYGRSLNLNALEAIVDTIRVDTPNRPAATSRFPLSGSVEVELGRIVYQRAQLRNVRASARITPEEINVSALRAEGYGGAIEGSASLGAGEQPSVAANLAMVEADMKLLDDLLFDGERKFRGIANATLEFSGPRASLRKMLAAGNGHMEWDARDGTFGKLGWATRLLGVLRATEVLSLSLPSLKDDGLTYATCVGRLQLVNGLAELEAVELKRPSYKMTATGHLDFANDASDVAIKVSLLQSLTQITDRIPIINRAADLTAGKVAVTVNMTGSPFDPQF